MFNTQSLVSEAVAMAVEMIDRLDDALLAVKDGYYSHAYRVTNHVKGNRLFHSLYSTYLMSCMTRNPINKGR